MGYARVVLLISAVLVVFAQSVKAVEVDARTSQLDSVASLTKPVTLTTRAASLKEILTKVQALTGARMRPSRDIAEDKATIRVKDRPAREVLRELARCFDLCWSEKQGTDGSYLYLWMDKRSLDDMSKRQLDDYLAITKQFDVQMQATAALVASGTEYTLSDQNTSSITMDEYDRLRLREAATVDPQEGAAVMQYMKFTQAQRKDLIAGKHVVVSGSAIASDALGKYSQAQSFDYWVDASLGGYLLKCMMQPDDSEVLLATAVFDDTRYDKIIDAADEVLAKDKTLDKDIATPKAEPAATSPATQKKASGEPASISLGPKSSSVQNPGEGSAATPATMSDGLLEVAETLDMPLVAQYLSEYTGIVAKGEKTAAAASTARKTGDRIAELSKLHKFVVEQDGGFLLAKSLLWHRLRSREVPEATIKLWQREITALTVPTLDVAVQMGSLPWGQFRGVISNEWSWFGSMDLTQLASCEYGLKLDASLSDGQRKAVEAGQAISCKTISDAQRYLFMQAFEQREQPTYDQAKDANWVDDAVFSVEDRVGDYDLYAVAGMRQLGSIDLLAEMENGKKAGLPDASGGEDAQLDYVMGGAVKKLLAALAVKYPDIPSGKITMYMTRNLSFNFSIGENDRNSSMTYSARRR